MIKYFTGNLEVEEAAIKQVSNIASMPFVYPHVSVMPDVHAGIGATVGSVIPTIGAVIPAAVGVDIGCGMTAVRTTLRANDLPDSLYGLRCEIECRVPHGRTANGGPGDRGAWGQLSPAVENEYRALADGWKVISEFDSRIARGVTWQHLGTLGGGNHFIEVCLDESDFVWVMLHSGSRGPGNRIGTSFINKAREDMRKWFINLPDIDLAYIPTDTPTFSQYVQAVNWAQEFAKASRRVMLKAVVDALKSVGLTFEFTENAIDCHHNYISFERHGGKDVIVTRKGAVRARSGDLGIIPGSMGAKSYIVRGKGNTDSLHSCSHGAGRRMSRTEARKTFTLDDHVRATSGIECRKDVDVLDETPAAYKDIDQVMHAQMDLVDIVHTLRQVLCVKG